MAAVQYHERKKYKNEVLIVSVWWFAGCSYKNSSDRRSENGDFLSYIRVKGKVVKEKSDKLENVT